MKTVPRLRFKEFNNDWLKSRLDEVATITTGNTPSTAVDEYYGDEYLFVSPVDISINRFVSDTKTKLTVRGFQQGRKIPKNSVMFVCIGSTIGKVGQASVDCITNQQINSLEANKSNSNDFVDSLLEKNGGEIKLLAGTQAVPLINKSTFSGLKFFFPSLPEQQKIASFLSAVDEKIQQLTHKKQLLEQYKKGVMQQLFSGKMRFKDENGKAFPKWGEKKLGDIANITIGEFVIRTKQTPDGKYPVYNGGASYTGFYNDYNNEGNKIIISARGANAGFVNYEIGRYWAGNSCYSVDITDKNVNIVNYIFYYLKFYQNLFTDYQQAANIPSVSKKETQIFKIICPITEEQQKIASFLSTLDQKIEHVTNQITQANSFKKGLLQQMFV